MMYIGAVLLASLVSTWRLGAAQDWKRPIGIEALPDEQNLTSRNFPNNYPGDLHEEWVIHTKHMYRETNIYIEIVFLDIELSPDCSKDSLRIYSGYQRPKLLANLCGTDALFSAEVDQKVWIQFVSDNTTQAQGFFLSYKDISDDHDEAGKAEYSSSWGALVVIVFVIVVVVLFLTILSICLFTKKTNRKGPYKVDHTLEFQSVVCDSTGGTVGTTGNGPQRKGTKENGPHCEWTKENGPQREGTEEHGPRGEGTKENVPVYDVIQDGHI